ncbi:MAG: hypothetical protein KGS72_20350 [Cyanobacteria bacterium REEB67]|nr:hypothetical protein [Cyanobacteria bacterium REEB67]
MNSGAKNNFDKVEAEIAKVETALEASSRAFYENLAVQHLLEARRINLEARRALDQGNRKKSDTLLRLATFQLGLAAEHTRTKAALKRGSKKEFFSGMPQQHIFLLRQGILEFKSLVEWKNCTLRQNLKAWFIEIVELYEDALNYLRTDKASAAEHAALAGLLLHEHLCLVAQAEHYDQLSISGLCARNKLPADAFEIYKVCLTLHKSRRKLNQRLPHLIPAAQTEAGQARDRVEEAFVQAIFAFAAENKKGLAEKLLATHTGLATIDGIILASLCNDGSEVQVDFELQAKNSNNRAGNHAATEADFARDAKTFQDLLSERVDDRELLSLRVRTITKRFEDLCRQHQAGKQKDTITLAVLARADLEKLQLLLSQASLFKNS